MFHGKNKTLSPETDVRDTVWIVLEATEKRSNPIGGEGKGAIVPKIRSVPNFTAVLAI